MGRSNAERQAAFRMRQIVTASLRNDWNNEIMHILLKMQEEIEALRNDVTILLRNGAPPPLPLKERFPPDPLLKKITPTPPPSDFSFQEKSSASPLSMLSFDRFWEAYPRKIGKLAAKRAFDKARKLTDLETMLAAIERYKEHKRSDVDYCHPATWLNQGRWADEYGNSSGAGVPERPPPTDAEREAALERILSDLRSRGLAPPEGMGKFQQ